MPPNIATTTRPTAQPAASRLAMVRRGHRRMARRIMIYGDGGLGKTSLVAQMRSPILIDVNQGSDGIDIARYVFDDAGRTKPANFDELLGAVRDVAMNGAENFGTLALDVLSDIEPLVWAEVVRRDGKAKSITDGNLGFNKGYEAAVDDWRRLVQALEDVRSAGIDVVLLDHFDVKKEKNPEGADYGRGMPKIHPLASKFLHTWCDYTFLMQLESVLVPDNADERKAKKQYASSDGERILCGRPAAAYLAKSRPEIADSIRLPRVGGWQTVLRAIVNARVPDMPAKEAGEALAALERAGDDVSKLEDLDNWCASKARKE